MTGALALQIVLRLLPSVVLVAVGILVVRDAPMKRRWADLLVRTGSISYSKADDPKIQDGVRIPFFILAGLFLIWPVLYYFRDSYAQTPITPISLPSADSKPKKVTPGPTPLPTPTPDPVTRPDAPRPASPMAPQPAAPGSPGAPAQGGLKKLG